MKLEMRELLSILIFPVRTAIGWLAGLIPRNPNVWVFGSEGNKFSDNSKYLFIHVTEQHPEITAVWISGSSAVVEKIRAAGGAAYRRWSIGGVYYSIIAMHWFISYYVNDINHWFSRSAVVTNLWHGTPIKKIEFDIVDGHLASLYQAPTFLEQYVFKSHIFRKPDFVIGTSGRTNDIYSSSFRVGLDRCLPFGLPRLDILGTSKAVCTGFIKKWGRPETQECVEDFGKFAKIFLYAPTFRDSNPNFLKDLAIDTQVLNRALQAGGALLALKLHPAIPQETIASYKNHSNIRILDSAEDVYPILPFCDHLITDYSSIFIDFLLLDRDISFFSFDIEEYTSKSRSLYYDYAEITPGEKVLSVEAFLRIFDQQGAAPEFASRRTGLLDFFYDHRDFDSSTRVVAFFKNRCMAGL
jgi:CDP-glycerol glycerophosphotransferase (TagB/SpsB family)